jgi:hypothetical protein
MNVCVRECVCMCVCVSVCVCVCVRASVSDAEGCLLLVFLLRYLLLRKRRLVVHGFEPREGEGLRCVLTVLLNRCSDPLGGQI